MNLINNFKSQLSENINTHLKLLGLYKEINQSTIFKPTIVKPTIVKPTIVKPNPIPILPKIGNVIEGGRVEVTNTVTKEH